MFYIRDFITFVEIKEVGTDVKRDWAGQERRLGERASDPWDWLAEASVLVFYGARPLPAQRHPNRLNRVVHAEL